MGHLRQERYKKPPLLVKRGVSGRAGRHGVIMKAFQMVKESLGIRRALQRGCRNVSDKEGIHKRSKGWKMSHSTKKWN